MVIWGQEDNFIPTAYFQNLCEKIQEPKECYSIPEADHFWVGFESDIAAKIATFFNKYLPH
jgi:alpha/beta superfamily hydrolase